VSGHDLQAAPRQRGRRWRGYVAGTASLTLRITLIALMLDATFR
jgi:hypothetical protein